METLRTCVDAMALIPQVGPYGNPSAFSDLKVAQYMCQAGAKAALENIDINLPSIKDANFLSQVSIQVNELKLALEKAGNQEIKKPTS
jgi:formiminotetrahydrofolate cyclodeaminase